MQELHGNPRDAPRGMHVSTDMMLSRRYGDGKIGTVFVGAHPCSLQPSPGDGAIFLNEVDQRLPWIGLGQSVLGFVELHIEAGALGTAGRCGGTGRRLGERRCRKEEYDESD